MDLVAPASEILTFIDLVNLTDSEEHPRAEDFRAIGNTFNVVVLDYMPSSELRLAACSSSRTG